MAHGSSILQNIGVASNLPLLNFFNSALNQQQSRDINQQALEQRETEAPFRNELLQLESQLSKAQQPARLLEAEEASDPISSLNRRDRARLESISIGALSLSTFLESGDIEGARQNLLRRKDRLKNLGLPTETTDEALQMLDSDPKLLRRRTNQAVSAGEQAGFIKPSIDKSVSQREFEDLVVIAKKDPEGKTVEGRAAGVKLGIIAKASTSAAERIARDPDLTASVAKSEAKIEGAREEAKETSKLKAQRKFKPQIAKAVKLAEKAATERGEVLTDLARMEASLPGIKEVFNELVELSSIATSTLAGRAFDFAVKESGFGSTKGANARAKLIAIVDNQVLPLLRETFGAAFTVKEGDNLKASLVDPNASPAQKREQLTAFIAQKERNIRTKQAQLDQGGTLNVDVPVSTDLSTLTLEQLKELRARGGQ